MKRATFWSWVWLAAGLGIPASSQADVISEWNQIALVGTTAARQLPPDATRTMALVHLAMFEAVNAVQQRYAPYAFKGRAPAGASAEAAAAAAARSVLLRLFPDQRQEVEASYAASLAQVGDGPGRVAGVALGEQVAAQCLALRASDGTEAPNTYRPVTAPGVYVPTTLPLASQWATVTPWFMNASAQFRPGPPPALASREWARDYNESKGLGASQSLSRTPEQTEVARFWTITGPASWNPVVRSLVTSGRLSLLESARLFALVNMAATDALIAVFDAKYAFAFWRPITAIRNGDLDGNDATDREAGWLPLIDTPLHPEYPCAHCITSAAVGAVLEAQFGDRQVPPISMTSPTAPGVTRRWQRIRDYVHEVGNARIWGGVHYRTSTQVGDDLGRKIGELAVKSGLTPIR